VLASAACLASFSLLVQVQLRDVVANAEAAPPTGDERGRGVRCISEPAPTRSRCSPRSPARCQARDRARVQVAQDVALIGRRHGASSRRPVQVSRPGSGEGLLKPSSRHLELISDDRLCGTCRLAGTRTSTTGYRSGARDIAPGRLSTAGMNWRGIAPPTIASRRRIPRRARAVRPAGWRTELAVPRSASCTCLGLGGLGDRPR